jgi:hypothetical protein
MNLARPAAGWPPSMQGLLHPCVTELDLMLRRNGLWRAVSFKSDISFAKKAGHFNLLTTVRGAGEPTNFE